MSHRLASTFEEMVEMIAVEDPVALVLGWWCRVEKALAYYTIAYHGKKMGSVVQALRVLQSDARVERNIVDRLHNLRRRRNSIAHEETNAVSPEEAKAFASEAWELGWLIGNPVPDELAISIRPSEKQYDYS